MTDDPQRKRPPRLSPDERSKRNVQELLGAVSPSGWTIDEMIGMDNPFHEPAASEAAEPS